MDGQTWIETTRTAYDLVAADYAETLRDRLAGDPLERAMLGAFAELVPAGTGLPVADLGCGPGRITGHLHALGLPVFGIDLSPQMVAVARRTYPDLRFEEGSLLALDLPGASLAGATAWFSIIHAPTEQLPVICAELHRVLAPGAPLALAFQIGDEDLVHRDHAYGHDLSIYLYRRSPDLVARLLREAGLDLVARMRRETPDPDLPPAMYLIARRPAGHEVNTSYPKTES
ncbi:methyltransferase domain-containing protein [Solwaraspora sp. WMMD1047]|uniref:class I SAM-dependent DNA methyltransferase n=1 Tax=Solwaraspora sp. WMMD1047 TaxID=3016102 RepID=UPI0024161904|nr:class I SAM-dependent methyltransferase [Solwaraspora sp. WMMD1047]MDG4834489.1 methyltransferase domain-containing protein [Solwaraspora sp. WMMD1047]